MELAVVNIVATVTLSTPLNLKKMVERIGSVHPCSGAGNWLKMRLPPEDYYIAFYKSGKFLITGAKSMKEVECIAERVLDILRKACFDIYIDHIVIHNLVMVGNIRIHINLEKIVYAFDDSKVSYEPEQFSGLIYEGFGAHFIIFPTGKVIITGVKDVNSGIFAINQLQKMLQDYIDTI